MLLNMTMLAQSLDDVVQRVDLGSDSSEMRLSHAELLDAGVRPVEGVVCLADATAGPLELPRTGARLRLICIGDPGDLSSLPSPPELIVVGGITLPRLLARVQRVFRRYERWDEELKGIMMRGGMVSELLGASMAIFRSNILVHDRDLRAIAYRTHDLGEDESPLRSLTVDRPLSPAVASTFADTVAANCPGTDPFSIRGPHFWTSSSGPQCLNMNVVHDGTVIARVVLTTTNRDEEPTARDVAPFVVLCSYIEAILGQSYSRLLSTAEDALSSLITRMVRDEHVPEPDMREAAAGRGWDHRGDHFALLAVSMAGGTSRHLSTAYPLMSVFSLTAELLRETHTLVHEGTGLVLVNLSRVGIGEDEVRHVLERIGAENGCRFCAGRPVRGLRGIAKAHREAMQTLGLARRAAPACGKAAAVVTIDDVMLGLVDQSVAAAVAPLTVCPRGLLAVIRHDNAHHSELYRTLRTYVEQSCSPSRSARLLYVQRSTFLYRLHKALELLDMDLDDPDDQLRLRLAFRLLDLMPARELAQL
ncbi:MAG: hypothetical protein HFJ75_03730 [Eggerthellaceae bacterium]|nr:hypothetical protein [Eggerthellaceae bacterium]